MTGVENGDRPTWARLLRRIELRVLSSLTPKRSFLCDGHPRLCIHCKRVREWVKRRPIPNVIQVFGADGRKWLWTSLKEIWVIHFKGDTPMWSKGRRDELKTDDGDFFG